MSDLLNKASLVMVPSGYKEDTVYSVVPTDGSGDLAFTRASNGTRINSAGLVEVVPWNLLQQSETIGVSPWSNSNLTITANSVIAPNGTTTADVLTETTATTTQFRTQQTTPQSTNIYTLSVYVKNITGTRQAYIDLGPVTGFFNFATETIYSASAIGSFEKLANGWYRIALTTANAITPSTIYMGLGQNNSETYTGNGTSAIAFWGAQLNIGSTAKPYFPTTDRLNVPRLTYQNGGGGCPFLLLEKQSTNLQTYSEQMDNAAWSKFNVSITANGGISPDGTQNADLTYITSGTNVQNYNSQTRSGLTNGATYTQSVFLKASGFTWAIVDNVSGSAGAWFNLANGTIGTVVSGSIAKIENYGNGWYRCSVTSNAFSTSGYGDYRLANADNDLTATANGTNGILAWGFQFEASSYPTSYIPTTSSSATRVADYVSRSGLALTNSTFAVNFKPLDYVVELFDFEKTGGGRMFYIAVQSNGFITFNSVSGGTIGAVGSVIPKNQTCKLAFSLNASTSNVKVYINGSIIGTYATNITTFGAFFGLQSFGYNPGTQIEQIAIFPSVLTDAECISLTS